MPVQRGTDSIGYFYRWGESGKKYYYKFTTRKVTDKGIKRYTQETAKEKAARQGRAIKASQARAAKIFKGGSDKWYYKYMKYKTKYLELKSGM